MYADAFFTFHNKIPTYRCNRRESKIKTLEILDYWNELEDRNKNFNMMPYLDRHKLKDFEAMNDNNQNRIPLSGQNILKFTYAKKAYFFLTDRCR